MSYSPKNPKKKFDCTPKKNSPEFKNGSLGYPKILSRLWNKKILKNHSSAQNVTMIGTSNDINWGAIVPKATEPPYRDGRQQKNKLNKLLRHLVLNAGPQ